MLCMFENEVNSDLLISLVIIFFGHSYHPRIFFRFASQSKKCIPFILTKAFSVTSAVSSSTKVESLKLERKKGLHIHKPASNSGQEYSQEFRCNSNKFSKYIE